MFFTFAQNQDCKHKNQETYHLCKRDELYKLKYYLIFLSIGSRFRLSELLKAALGRPWQGQAAQAATGQVICSTCASFPFDYPHTSLIFNKLWELSVFSAGNHIPFPQPPLARGFSQQRYWNNIGFLCCEEPSTTRCSELFRPARVWVRSL